MILISTCLFSPGACHICKLVLYLLLLFFPPRNTLKVGHLLFNFEQSSSSHFEVIFVATNNRYIIVLLFTGDAVKIPYYIPGLYVADFIATSVAGHFRDGFRSIAKQSLRSSTIS